jgi:transcriptional regulator with XRE-family HTH domain
LAIDWQEFMTDGKLEEADSFTFGRVQRRGTSENERSFARLLQRFRESRGMSKSDLAKRARVDPSTITRFEQGTRAPERATVLMLAQAMVLPLAERDELLASAGYRAEYWDEPLIVELVQILNDPDLPSEVAKEIRQLIAIAVNHGKLGRAIFPSGDARQGII